MLGFGIGGFTLGRPASGGPYAGLTLLSSFPNDINDAYWTKKEGTVTTGVADPRGGTTAERFLESIVNDTHEVSKNGVLDLVSGSRYVMEAVVKPVGGRHLQLQIWSNSYANFCKFDFDLTNGVVGSFSVDAGDVVSNTTKSVAAVGNGFYRCRLRFTASATFTDANLFWTVQTSPSADGAYAGDITKGLDFDSLGLYQVA